MKKLFTNIIRKLYFKTMNTKDIDWKDTDYGDIGPDKFEVIYCNNYKEICNSNKDLEYELSCIEFKITLDKKESILINLIQLLSLDIEKFTLYKNIYIKENIHTFELILKGNINYYKDICNRLPHNIITKYIKSYLFPNKNISSIEERFLNNYKKKIFYNIYFFHFHKTTLLSIFYLLILLF